MKVVQNQVPESSVLLLILCNITEERCIFVSYAIVCCMLLKEWSRIHSEQPYIVKNLENIKEINIRTCYNFEEVCKNAVL